MKNYIFPFDSRITLDQRKSMMRQEPQLIWLTGLSSSGKSTLALRLEHHLFRKGYKAYLLDGDNIRNGLCNDLSFTEKDRKENLRRVGEVAKLMLDSGLIVICAFISPYEEERKAVRKIVDGFGFIEIYVNCSVEACEARDVKGLYAKARNGIIPNFTGISAPYQPPKDPDIILNTEEETIEESLYKVINFVEKRI